jgi:hypothetical protein
MIGRGHGAAALTVALLAACSADGSGGEVGDGSFPGRRGPAIVATDRGVLLFSGRGGPEQGLEAFDDAVLVDPTTGERTGLPSAPYGLDAASGVSTGDAVVLTGIGCDDVVDVGQERECEPGRRASLRLDLGDGDWDEIDGPEGPNDALFASILGALDDGRVIAVQHLNISRPMLLWALAPGADEWDALPSPGVRGDGVCLAGNRLAVVTADRIGPPTSFHGNPEPEPADPEVAYGRTYRDPRVHTLDPASDDPTWAVSEPMPAPAGVQQRPRVACMGSRVLVESAGSWAIHDPRSDTWTAVEGPRGSLAFGTQHWTGGELVVLRPEHTAPSGVYDPDADRWTPDSDLPDPYDVAWTGEALVEYTGGDRLIDVTPLP